MRGEVQDCILAKVHTEKLFAVSRESCGRECGGRCRDLTQVVDLAFCKKQLANGRKIDVVTAENNIARLLARFSTLLSRTKRRIAKRRQHFRTHTTTSNFLAQ